MLAERWADKKEQKMAVWWDRWKVVVMADQKAVRKVEMWVEMWGW